MVKFKKSLQEKSKKYVGESILAKKKIEFLQLRRFYNSEGNR